MAWAVTGFLTIVGALSYGELAAMMPRAGGQYVYLRESLGPLWGFLYGWTLFLVIQTGTIAAVGVAFGKFLGHFFPSVAASHWLIGPFHVGVWQPIRYCSGRTWIWDLNTQNLSRNHHRNFSTVLNIFGLKTGALVQNIFTIAKVSALAALVFAGILVGRNAQAVAANFTDFWRLTLPHSRQRSGVGDHLWSVADDSGGRAGRIAIFRRRLEQRDLYRRRSAKSQTQSAAFAGDRHRRGDSALHLSELHLPECAPLNGDPNGAT